MSVLPRQRRRTVAGRLLGSYLLVLLAFTVTTAWSFRALRAAARDAELLRAGYVPLLLRVGEALAEQNVFNAQLNHITAAKNSGDIREWIETARRARPLTFALVREAAERDLTGEADPAVRRFREDITREAVAIERSLGGEPERFSQLFQAIATGDRDTAEKVRSDLAKREAEGAQRLRAIRSRVEDTMATLTTEARKREAQSMQLLIGLVALAFFVGAVSSFYARRVLAPLSVTSRAEAVARGDLTPHDVVPTDDEIGELATTFEGMVAAIQRARSELVQAERLATIGKMAAHVTHEIRNPLSSIGLNIELLEEEVTMGTDLAEAAQLVSAIKAEVERLSRIAEQYLSVARRPRPHLEREQVVDLVRELCAFVRPELDRASVKLRVDEDAVLPEIDLDESQLRQALLNLIRNAREAMPKGGELVVAVRNAAGRGVEIHVDDNGPGVPEDVRASIFDPFFTTKQRGTGLGLAVTREIIEAHGGTIDCEPLSAGGTRFRIALPPQNSVAEASDRV